MYATYRNSKLVVELDKYFEFTDIKCFRDCLVKERLGLLLLNDSAFKRKFASDVSNLCSFCNVVGN